MPSGLYARLCHAFLVFVYFISQNLFSDNRGQFSSLFEFRLKPLLVCG